LSHPKAPKKCQSVHGHSWCVDVYIGAPDLDERDMLVEFGAFKRRWFDYLDSHVCHHLALAASDPYCSVLQQHDPRCRLLVLDGQPTTEYLAKFFYEQAQHIVEPLRSDATIICVKLKETERNMAIYGDPR